jgi:tRNA(Ile)-lysidine synthase
MSLSDRFTEHYHADNLFTEKDGLLLAVSGGIDSISLCRLCQLSGLNFAMMHCNFQLRGADSLRDEKFVISLAAEMGVPVFTTRFDTKAYAAAKGISTQEAARDLRYAWFEEIRVEHHYDYILTAHHADDNLETVVMNFFRGTGIRGLTGIGEKHGRIRRPLLFARRRELEKFITDERLSFVQDVTNFSDDYTRNYFRNTIIPAIEKVYPEVRENLIGNITRFSETEILYSEAIDRHRKKLVTQKGEELFIPVALLKLQEAHRSILYEIIKDYHFSPGQLTDVLQLLNSDSGKYVLSPTHRILKNRKHLVIAPLERARNVPVIIEGPGSHVFDQGTLNLGSPEPVTGMIPQDSLLACLDAKHLVFPLILRRWRTGDYFYPLGMSKKKKVSRFLIDQKLSMTDKEKVWVVEMNQKIIWVIGLRIDDRFKIRPSTKTQVQLRFLKA